MQLDEQKLDTFLWWMCERQQIYLRREVRNEPPPWTDDPVLQDYHFCNVHRELDRGTRYLIETILDTELADRTVLFNTILYRFFNDPQTGRTIGLPIDPDEFNPDECIRRVERTPGSMFSSAYRVTTRHWANSDKKHVNILRGVIRDDVYAQLDDYTRIFEYDDLESVFYTLTEIRGVGEFLAYELATDLNYFHLPTSENDFVNIGPGAQSGLFEIFGRSKTEDLRWMQKNQTQLFDEYGYQYPYLDMKPRLTLRDLEHSCCEFNKYIGIRFRGETSRRGFEAPPQESLGDFSD